MARMLPLVHKRPIALAASLVLAILVSGTVSLSSARADGDPGSDVLVYQSLFVTSSAGVSVARQVQLNTLLEQARKQGVPVRVAIVAHPSDLGAVSELWGKPRAYARFLGYELSLAYRQRLLVVMPSGFGMSWPGHSTRAAYRLLAGRHVASGGDGLASAAEFAVTALARTAGVHLQPQPVAAPPSGSSAAPARSATSQRVTPPASHHETGEGWIIVAGLVVLLGAAVIVMRAVLVARARAPTTRPTRSHRAWPLARGGWRPPSGVRTGAIVTTAAVAVLAGITVVIQLSGSSSANSLATNPYLDPGTVLAGRPAPDFTLSDETGRPVSLSAYRGKVVFLDFNDSECTTICPLTTTAMRDAQRMLGPAGAQVELLGVDANPKATSVADVLSYSQLHGMLGHWHFLTGSLRQLRRVWGAYHVQAEINRGLIEHTPALFVIDPAGRLRRVYVTQQSYSAVGQFGHLLAQEASGLLPGHPKVSAGASYGQIPTITPTDSAALPRSDGGSVTIGPGRARLFLFFATWDQEVMSLGGQLKRLNAYVPVARRSGLPSLTAVDQGSVEPSPTALQQLIQSVRHPLSFPVAIDTSGRVADGYAVQGQPWFVLTSATGKILWYWNIDTQGWLSTAKLVANVKNALARAPSVPAGRAAGAQALAGSPAPLTSLHQQAGRLLGSDADLTARIRALRGYPIVVNAWASWCAPCRSEFNLFASASIQDGRAVAFLGADTDDAAGDAQTFLTQHRVSYPSYRVTSSQLQPLLPGGLQGLPTTIFINRQGKVAYIHTGQYGSQGSLDGDIQTYAR